VLTVKPTLTFICKNASLAREDNSEPVTIQ